MSNFISTCHYLYGMPAQEVFAHNQSAELIDQCLETLMKVHVFLLTHRDPFFLIQPTAFNDQCHLYGLRALQIRRVYSKMTNDEKQARNDTNKFLHLSLILSFAFIINPHFYVEVVKQGLRELKGNSADIHQSPSRNKLSQFLTALESRKHKAAARASYNTIFMTYVHDTVTRLKEREGAGALDHELFTLLRTEELRLPPRIGEGDCPALGSELTFYTPPKFAGVALMLNMLEVEGIPFAIKVMAITRQGTGRLSYLSRKPEENEPVLIFETFATDGSLTLLDCRQAAMHCPSYHRKSTSLLKHPAATCLFCNPQKIDLTPFQERLSFAVQNPRRMFLALGADYILSAGSQTSYLKYFEDREHYPTLATLFKDARSDIDTLGLSMNKPIAFSVSFAYADCGAYAMSEQMLSNQPCLDHLRERQLIKPLKQGERK